MISLDLMKSSEVRIAGDQSNYGLNNVLITSYLGIESVCPHCLPFCDIHCQLDYVFALADVYW